MVGSMSSSGTLLKWLCWALVVFTVASALISVAISLNLLTSYPNVPDSLDFVQRLTLFRQGDQQALPVYLVSSVLALVVFALAALIGVALRPVAIAGSGRDVMATLFVAGGIVGIVAQLVLIGVNETAAQGYCDCGYKAEELIAQTKALDLGFTIQSWLSVGALVMLGIGVAAAGRLVDVSAAWRTLSYVIAIGLVIAAVLLIINQGFYSTLVTGFTAGLLVAIWAAMLALAVGRRGTTMSEAAPMQAGA